MVLSFVLSGCNTGPTPEEEIYETLEEVVNLETSFKEQQNPLVELEKKEKELYDQIISLGMKEFDKIVALSEEALAIVEERETRLNEENASIEASKEKFNLVKDYIANLEDEKLSEDANQLIELMENRYSSYSTLYSNYLEAIGHDKKLYTMFQSEDLTLEQLEEQIKNINESYEKVIAANEEFNNFTEQYNESKLAFYENAGLEVVYKD
ncbi:YkyA family protein [Bacillus luteolus]|uniref:YkyA family protein n=2 Tax=Litchfieldia luteola TaxID=682179 RepID=A0ABR9QK70_9BACI|nr:YkyA family protein [Cytobacillus luteolus]